MNSLLIPLLVLTFQASCLAGWFSHDDHQHEKQLEQQLQQEAHHNSSLTTVIVVLSIGCVVTFVVGTMVGSRTRRQSNEN